ncbi:hypothetical protein SAMN05660964_00734 [Thiothrix caldifontis]|uniref:Uncharacterized protein n=1 Tax=Thiothrix caldifontis TaxID=525918 RepID=A0A1H3XL34_9GAMM|nr:hypothetical protein [Thiothrix caldifontis]SEA00147.1 hypothetical protein SAMN05660964_00734 [Thiothrix caldifontis]
MGTGHFGSTDNDDGAIGFTNSSKHVGLVGKNDSTDTAVAPGGSGVFGLTIAPNAAGVFGANNSPSSPTNMGRGVQGNGPQAGVGGFSEVGFGVIGQSKSNSGIVATSESGQGLSAFSDNDVGIFAKGASFSGVFEGALVVNKGPNPKNPAIPPSDINGSIVVNHGNLFLNEGSLFVNKGDVILTGADCAEEFDVSSFDLAESGTVMVIDDTGALKMSDKPYDTRVAGVISGAGEYKPGLVLDRRHSQKRRQAIALIGKVYCKVDAQYGAIDIGDLLTSSATLGHAMKASDPAKSFGAILGKALSRLSDGQGLIPILVTLQ